MNEIIFLVTEAPEGGYCARALGESIFTEAETLNDLRRNIREAVACHFDDDKSSRPRYFCAAKPAIITP